MRFRHFILFSVIPLVVASGWISAQEDRSSLEERFRQLDVDGDGKLTFEESGQARWFRFLDRKGNADGFVTLDELPGERSAKKPALVPIQGEDLRAWFRKLDANGNGFIERDELDDPRELRGADRNADGKISMTEGRRYFGDIQATLAARSNPDIYEPWKRTEGQKPLRTAESGDPLLNLRFSRDLPTGNKDSNDVLITGTECMHLETHGGMLFASLGGWNHDKSRLPWPGGSVAVKESASAIWRVDGQFGPRTGRPASLRSVLFTTDCQGNRLRPPVPVLLCGVSGLEDPGKVVIWSRDDIAEEWVKMFAGQPGGRVSPEVRVIFDHVDAVTGIHHVFAAASSGMLFRGAYDPETPGSVSWSMDEPEISGRERRLMAAAEWDGAVYLTVDLEPTEPENGGLFRRIDGIEPRWERVTGWKWSTPNPDTARPWFGMRGLTAVGDALLGAREQPGTIDRVDPAAPAGKQVAMEYDVRSGLLDAWDADAGNRGGMAIIAYNDMVTIQHPTSGQTTALIPLGTRHPQGGRLRSTNELGASAWYLVRYGEGDYGLGRVFDPDHPLPNRASGGLRATRTIRPSPFPEETGRVWYFAGFDAFGGPSHLNTAWVYKGVLPKETIAESRP